MNLIQVHIRHIVKFASIILALLLTSPAFATAVHFTGNNHWYDTVVVANNGGSWTDAKAAAELLGGYLLTVTSQAEQEFLENSALSRGEWWAGGSDATTEDEWKWMTGPEAGMQFWQGKRVGSGGHTTAPFNYAKWYTNEPNSSGEDYLSWNHHGPGATSGWNDVGVTNSIMDGYVIEYDQNPAGVPEPATLTLLGLGLAGIGFSRRKAV